MKKLTILLFLCTSVTYSFAQINWSEFREPDGTLQRLTIDPRITYISSNNVFNNGESRSLRGQLLTRYSMDMVKERHVVNFNVQHNLIYNSQKQANMIDAENRTSNDINIIGFYSYYLNSRRGLFLRVQPDLRFSYTKVSNVTGSHNNRLNSNFVLGYGRLENVSTVYQSIRIDRNLYGNEGNNQEKIFDLASELRSIDYNNALDTRMRNVENQSKYLQTLENHGYDLSSYINIANAIDMFRFERPFVLQHGYEVSAGLFARSIGDQGDLFTSINAIYARAINAKWHWSLRGNVDLELLDDINGNVFTLRNNLSYIPTARTQITLVQSYFHGSNSDFNQLSLGLNAAYFVSPQLNLFLNTSYFRINSDFVTDRNQFSHDMGLKYFFF